MVSPLAASELKPSIEMVIVKVIIVINNLFRNLFVIVFISFPPIKKLLYRIVARKRFATGYHSRPYSFASQPFDCFA